MLTRGLVVLLAALLLQPPGYCLCRLGAMALRPAARPAPAPPAAEAPRKACPCCRHAEPSAPRPGPSLAERPAPPADHLPGCPVSPTASVGRDPTAEPLGPPSSCGALPALPAAAGPASAAPRPGGASPPPADRHAPLRC